MKQIFGLLYVLLQKKHFPKGFFVIFVAEPDNYDCDGDNLLPNSKKEVKPLNHTSIITFTIKENITPQEYASAMILTMIVILVFCLIAVILSCVFHSRENKNWRISQKCNATTAVVATTTVTVNSNTNIPTGTNIISKEEIQQDGNNGGYEGIASTSKNVIAYPTTNKGSVRDNREPTAEVSSSSMVNGDSNFDTIAISNDTDVLLSNADIANIGSTDGNINTDTADNNPYKDIDKLLKKPRLMLSDLATKNPNSLNSETNNFFCHVITVGIFYGTPVVQLVLTHQRVRNNVIKSRYS